MQIVVNCAEEEAVREVALWSEATPSLVAEAWEDEAHRQADEVGRLNARIRILEAALGEISDIAHSDWLDWKIPADRAMGEIADRALAEAKPWVNENAVYFTLEEMKTHNNRVRKNAALKALRGIKNFLSADLLPDRYDAGSYGLFDIVSKKVDEEIATLEVQP